MTSRVPVKENDRFTKLVTQKVIGLNKHRSRIWECKCDCGNIVYVTTASLTSGNTKSCGCLHAESLQKYGKESRKLNQYDLSGEYGIGFTSKNEPFYFDLEDYNLIKDYTWNYNEDGYLISRPFGKTIRMHMLIMNSDGSRDVDHKNHITYDNRKENLRICDHFENVIHSKTYSNNTSGRKGVYWDNARQKWMAIITYNKKTVNLGRFDNFEDAVDARQSAEQKYHGEFICNL